MENRGRDVGKRMLRALKTALTCAMDCIFLCLSYALAISFSTFMGLQRGGFLQPYLLSLPIMIAGCMLVFWAFGIYRDLWGYLSLIDVLRMGLASFVAAFISYCAMRYTRGVWAVPTIGVVAFYLFFTFSLGVRILPNIALALQRHFGSFADKKNRKRILLVGAGEAGSAFIRDVQKKGENAKYRVVGVVDDDIAKQKHSLHGVSILGGTKDIQAIVKRYQIAEIVVAIPSASTETRRKLIRVCGGTPCKVRMMNEVSDVTEASVAALHDLNVGDLLGREEVVLDPAKMATYITGNVILVTGGGGSIGSELCRQLMHFDPARLIIFDFYENNAYNLLQELRLLYPDKARRVDLRVGSVQDVERLDEVFAEMQPDVVFHAAAYKHVPLMEECPEQAIRNNVFGTYNTAQCAVKYDVRRFVMISTDKAVNPTNIMGASKRLAELIIQSMNGQGTEFVSVRFGNVLGSNGSVVPIFRRQIEYGGPLTITHPDIVRYFMTIPEAARLVLQAGALAKGRETFVLDMGRPVKILDLAYSMIEIAGMEPDKDIQIKFTGLRPGEKLYEELLLDDESAEKTEDDKIFIVYSEALSHEERWQMLEKLDKTVENRGNIGVCVQEILPDYQPLPQDGA